MLAQVSDSTSVDSTQTEFAPSDSLQTEPVDSVTSKKKEKPKPENVAPWREKNQAFGSNVITNDSLMRWQIWPNWGDYQAYRKDVISYRQGTNGRVDAYHINGYQPLEQEIEMEGMSLNNPITGLVNYNLVPHRKIGLASESYRGNYHSNIRLRDYYIVKPISYLNYDEAGGAFRNLEFLVSQNFTAQTNLELSYWDRRGGGYYPNSEITGSQVFGRLYHHLNEQYLIRGMYVRNQFTNDEPFGYIIGDPQVFPFSEFTSAPQSSNGNSKLTRWDLVGGIYHRPDSSSAEDAGFEMSITNNEKKLRFNGDTLGWDLRSFGAKLFKRFDLNRISIRGEVEAQNHSLDNNSILNETSWTELDAELLASYKLFRETSLYGSGEINNRSDGAFGYDLTAGLKAYFDERLTVGVSASSFSKIPTMQAMYWQSKNYIGNPDLDNETGISTAANIDFKLTPTITFGASGRYKISENSTFLSPDSSFINSGKIDQIAGTVYGKFENHLFEIESSGTVQQFTYGSQPEPIAAFNHQDQIIWLRNSAFVKGYVFDRAAYLKVGVKTLLSPFYYSARSFNTELGYWQGNSTYQELPAYFRLDGELSARIRGIMVVLRWENALDGLGQAGYFESAGFPMPPRRLIVGIRAQFRN
jgi:hypothetical protein